MSLGSAWGSSTRFSPLMTSGRGMSQESIASSGNQLPPQGCAPRFFEQGASSFQGRGFRPLLDSENKERRLKGLCFTYDEKFSPEHICKNKNFRLMVLERDEDLEEPASPGEDHNTEEGQLFQLDGHSLARLSIPKSLREWGFVLGTKVRVLIDSGASHSFICHDLVRDLRLHISTTPDFWVKVGNGQNV